MRHASSGNSQIGHHAASFLPVEEVAASAIQAQTRHKSLAMLHLYIRQGTVFTDNAATQIGL